MAGDITTWTKKGYLSFKMLKSLLERGEVDKETLRKFEMFINDFEPYIQPAYTLGLYYYCNNNLGPLGLTPREKKGIEQAWYQIFTDYHDVKIKFGNFKKKRRKKEFGDIVSQFDKIIDRTSKLAKDYVGIVREKTTNVELVFGVIRERKSNEIIDNEFNIIRETFNRYLMSYAVVLESSSCYHVSKMEHYRLSDLMVPRLYDVRIIIKTE